jgi:hypothetical protein
VGPLADSQGPGAPQRLFTLKTWVQGQTLSRTDVQNYSSKDFDAQKIFLDFYENRKSASKDSSMHECFENSSMQSKKIKK